MPSWLVKAGLALAIAAIWEIAGRFGNPIFFPPLSTVLATLWSGLNSGELSAQLMISVIALAEGLFAAAVVAIAAGAAIRSNEQLQNAVAPVVAFLSSMPLLAIVPLIILYFGLAEISRVVAIVVCATFPMLNEVLRDAARPLAPRVAFPTRRNEPVRAMMAGAPVVISPHHWGVAIIAPVRAGLSYALSALVFTEMLAGSSGLGYFIMKSFMSLHTSALEAGILAVGAVAVAAQGLLSQAESYEASLFRRHA
jgi:ABC-type nitrate/sulfonate/bicarbonate transport system permease component